MRRRIWSIVLTLALCLGLLPLAAAPIHAAEYNLVLAGIQVNDENKDDILGDGTARYDSSTNTLTLENCTINGSGIENMHLLFNYGAVSGLTIVLAGQNALIAGGRQSVPVDLCGTITITGDGDLVITGGAGSVDSSRSAMNADRLEFDENFTGTLIATGGETSDTIYSTGIYVRGSLSVHGGTVIATGGPAQNSCGICIGGIEGSALSDTRMFVTGGVLVAQGGNATSSSYGVYNATDPFDPGKDCIYIKGGVTVARAGLVNGGHGGTRAAFNIEPISGMGVVCGGWIIGNEVTGQYYVPNQDWTIVDGDVGLALMDLGTRNVFCYTADSSEALLTSEGVIDTHGHTAVFVDLREDESSASGLTLDAGDTIVQGGGTLIAVGGIPNDQYGFSTGLQANNLTINDGTKVIGIGGQSNFASLGVYADDMNASGGIMTGAGGPVTISYNGASQGLHCRSSLLLGDKASVLGAGGYIEDGNSAGILIDDDCTVAAGTSLLGTGGAASGYSCGFMLNDSLSLAGRFAALGGRCAQESMGAAVYTDVAVSDGMNVTALGGQSDASYGFKSGADIAVNGGGFRAAGQTAAFHAVSPGLSLTKGSGVILRRFTDYAGTGIGAGVDSVTDLADFETAGILCVSSSWKCPLYVAGVQVDWKNADDLSVIPGVTGTASYTVEDNTLHLDGADIAGIWGPDDYGGAVVYYGTEDFTISVTGTNTVTGGTRKTFASGIMIADPNAIDLNSLSSSVDADVLIRIEDGASLTVTGGVPDGTVSYPASHGIYYYYSGDLTVEGGGTLTAEGGAAGTSYGIYSGGSTHLYGPGAVNAGGNGSYCSRGLYSQGTLTIAGAEVNAEGADADASGSISHGICCGSLVIDDGSVDATAGKAKSNSYGIYSETSAFTVNGGTVTAVTNAEEGSFAALNKVPSLAAGMKAGGSTNADGSSAAVYAAADNDTYRWFKTPFDAWTVTVTAGAGMSWKDTSGAETQTDLTAAMTDAVYTADDGYYFPEDYAVAAVSGISVTRDNFKQITVSGTPAADADVVLADAAVKQKAATPSVGRTNCTTEDNNDGTITGVDAAMEYQKDGDAAWTDIAGTTVTGLEPGDYSVRVKESDTALASDPVSVTIAAYSAPTWTVSFDAGGGSGTMADVHRAGRAGVRGLGGRRHGI